jgi:hypothetical protein
LYAAHARRQSPVWRWSAFRNLAAARAAFSGSRRSSIQKSCRSPKRLPVAGMNCHGPTAFARLVARFAKPLSIIAR